MIALTDPGRPIGSAPLTVRHAGATAWNCPTGVTPSEAFGPRGSVTGVGAPVSVTLMTVEWCTTCSRDFEQPTCAEGHGADCPERFCVDCGLAVVLSARPTDEPARTCRTGRTAA